MARPVHGAEVLAPFLEPARNGGILVVPQIKAELEAALGRINDQLETSLLALENDLTRVQSIVAWDWIINALRLEGQAARERHAR